MTDHAVVIAGGGPTGMMLAGELALAGIDAVIVERRLDQHVDGSRAGGLHARTIEVLDQRGIAERFLDAGQVMQVNAFGRVPLDISDFPSPHAYGLALWQSDFEPILADWVAELGVSTMRGLEVVGFVQDADGVDVELSDGTALRAQYLVGCDGGRSLVRKAAGIDFVGLDASTSWMIAEMEVGDDPPLGFQHDRSGTHAMGPGGDGRVRVVITEPDTSQTGAPDLEELRAALVRVWGSDLGLRHATWTSRFTDMARQAATYRQGRVLVAGDAAHVHSPQGGQGLNVGVQDAVNLGWKLAQVVAGTSDEGLLDSYHAERHPIGARVLQLTMAQVALGRADERSAALLETLAPLFAMDGPRRHLAGMLSGLDVHYDLGGDHPLVGRRMPDLALQTTDGPTRTFELLHHARPVLVDLSGGDVAPWVDRVRSVEATYDGEWELPVIGEVPAPPAVLIRPDGHVAWAGELGDPELGTALSTWCGAAA